MIWFLFSNSERVAAGRSSLAEVLGRLLYCGCRERLSSPVVPVRVDFPLSCLFVLVLLCYVLCGAPVGRGLALFFVLADVMEEFNLITSA